MISLIAEGNHHIGRFVELGFSVDYMFMPPST